MLAKPPLTATPPPKLLIPGMLLVTRLLQTSVRSTNSHPARDQMPPPTTTAVLFTTSVATTCIAGAEVALPSLPRPAPSDAVLLTIVHVSINTPPCPVMRECTPPPTASRNGAPLVMRKL